MLRPESSLAAGVARSLRAVRRLGDDACNSSTAQQNVVAPASVPIAVPGAAWALPLAGVFSNGLTANISLSVSSAREADAQYAAWMALNQSAPSLAGTVPLSLSRLVRRVAVLVTAVDGCGRSATLNVNVTVNAAPVRSGLLPDLVVDSTGVQLEYRPLALASAFEDADGDELTFELWASDSGANGTLGPPPSSIRLHSSSSQALPTFKGLRTFNISCDPSMHPPGTTASLAIVAADSLGATAESRFSVSFVSHCQVSQFSSWTNCTELCDGGTQTRNRTVLVPPTGDSATACPTLQEQRECNVDSCATAPRATFSMRFEGFNVSTARDRRLNESLVAIVAHHAAVAPGLVAVVFVDAGVVELDEELAADAGEAETQQEVTLGRRLAGVGADAVGATAPVLLPVTEAIVTVLVPASARATAQAVAQALDSASRTGAIAAAVKALAGLPAFRLVLLPVSVSSQRVESNSRPVPRSRVVVVEGSADSAATVVGLEGADADGDSLEALVLAVPKHGTLTQLSDVFSLHGYPPVQGADLSGSAPSNASLVTGSRNRVAFFPSAEDSEPEGAFGFATHVLSDGRQLSVAGLTWFVPSHGRLAVESFFVDAQGWVISDNSDRQAALPGGGIVFEPYADGALDRYVLGIEAAVNPDAAGADRAQWAFVAPQALSGNLAGAYGGALRFAMGVFEGSLDDASQVEAATPLVELDCASCGGRSGVTLGHYTTVEVLQGLFSSPRETAIPLVPTAWRRRPATLNAAWLPVSECELVAVLSGLTGLRIRGDITREHEAVGLDTVAFTVAQAELGNAASAGAGITRQVAQRGLPLECRFALTGDVATGGTNAVELTAASP